ncbi:MAG TPA: alpha-hydroxy-acid oxidizing protein [Candidatus Lokiarchaeia archaeon]|nr:alpha-hydroxy-acid oxidizing protein [Candidatus Lokiarchaeia archaeon]
MALDENATLEDVRDIAREKMKGVCGVFPVCDGSANRVCNQRSYGKQVQFGGTGVGASFENNFKALAKINLKMHLVGPDIEPDTTYTFFDKKLSMPAMGASLTGVNSLGGESVITEKDFCEAVVNGCKDAGTIGWRGHTYTYSIDDHAGIDAIAQAGGWGVQIIKPLPQDLLLQYLKKAEDAGCVALGTDIDGCGSINKSRYPVPLQRKTIDDIKELVSSTSLPVIIKGVMCVEDALAIVEAGAAGLVVSNHGGRVLDHTPGTADVLPQIVDAVNGKIKIFADGGIRTGYDVLKMLALGAEGVLLGRDVARAAVGGGALGVKLQLDFLQKVLASAMKMTGCATLQDISRNILA